MTPRVFAEVLLWLMGAREAQHGDASRWRAELEAIAAEPAPRPAADYGWRRGVVVHIVEGPDDAGWHGYILTDDNERCIFAAGDLCRDGTHKPAAGDVVYVSRMGGVSRHRQAIQPPSDTPEP